MNKYEEQALAQQLGGDDSINDIDFTPAGDVPHVICRGESLSAISKKYYGKPGYWDKIYERNVSIIDQQIDQQIDNLPIGQSIIIP